MLRALVAKQDGTANQNGFAFARGSIRPTPEVKVTREFDPRVPPIGVGAIVLEGDDVYLEADLDPALVDGLTPALGGRFGRINNEANGDARVQEFLVLEVSFCTTANADPRIGVFRHVPVDRG